MKIEEDKNIDVKIDLQKGRFLKTSLDKHNYDTKETTIEETDINSPHRMRKTGLKNFKIEMTNLSVDTQEIVSKGSLEK